MRVFHADAVAAVDVIPEPFNVEEDRIIVDASNFEEGPAGWDGLGRHVHPPHAIRHQFVEGSVLVAVDGEILALRVQPRVPSREKLCRNHANPRGARNGLHTQISFLLFIPQCRGDFSQIDVLREGLEKGNHNKDLTVAWQSSSRAC